MAETTHQNDDVSSRTHPPSGTYIIQIPKDQVFRIPPPENAKLYRSFTTPRSSFSCRCCFCWFCSFFLFFFLCVALSAATLFFVFRPKNPTYTIQSVYVRNLTLTSQVSNPEFDLTFEFINSNKKMGVYYLNDSSISVYYNTILLSTGFLPVFYQGPRNATTLVVALTGSGIVLTNDVKEKLSKGDVTLNVRLRAPVKFKLGAVKTWRITVKVDCDVTVDKLTQDAKILSKSCDYGVDLW